MLRSAIGVGDEVGLGLAILWDLTILVPWLILIGSGLRGLEWWVRLSWRLAGLSLEGLLVLVSCGLGLHRLWAGSCLSGLEAALFEGFSFLLGVLSFWGAG